MNYVSTKEITEANGLPIWAGYSKIAANESESASPFDAGRKPALLDGLRFAVGISEQSAVYRAGTTASHSTN